MAEKTKQTYPAWIASRLSEGQSQNLARIISEAEQKTTGEIVLVIAKKSSFVGHVGLSLFFVLLCIFLILDLVILNGWSFNYQLGSGIIWAIVSAFISWFLQKNSYVQKVFVPEQDEVRSVWQKAELEFHRLDIKNTQFRTGILIFVSVMERKAVVLADQAISQLYPQETWNTIIKDLMISFGEKKWEEGLTAAIQKCGSLLAEKFPNNQENNNELTNHVRIID